MRKGAKYYRIGGLQLAVGSWRWAVCKGQFAGDGALAIYENGTQLEVPIYGASRLGMYNKASGTSVYQLTDHLGNVRAVISKNGSEAVAATSTTDYYPFGMPMPNRQIINGQPYRYAYQGQEKDPETGKEAFQLRLWDARIGRWLTTDPYGQFNSPYLGMGNDPVNGVDPDGGFFTDYKNKKTGETVHVKDDINQVVEIDDSLWSIAVGLSKSYDSNNAGDYMANNYLQVSGTLRSDLFYTVSNVLEGQKWVKYGRAGRDCFACATTQEKNNGGNPGNRFDRVDLWVPKKSRLVANEPLARSTITSILTSGHSVVTGVNYKNRNDPKNYNRLTKHFLNIVGQGNDKHGNYFLYIDNVANKRFPPASRNNKFRFRGGRWVDSSNWSGSRFTITEIRNNN